MNMMITRTDRVEMLTEAWSLLQEHQDLGIDLCELAGLERSKPRSEPSDEESGNRLGITFEPIAMRSIPSRRYRNGITTSLSNAKRINALMHCYDVFKHRKETDTISQEVMSDLFLTSDDHDITWSDIADANSHDKIFPNDSDSDSDTVNPRKQEYIVYIIDISGNTYDTQEFTTLQKARDWSVERGQELGRRFRESVCELVTWLYLPDHEVWDQIDSSQVW